MQQNVDNQAQEGNLLRMVPTPLPPEAAVPAAPAQSGWSLRRGSASASNPDPSQLASLRLVLCPWSTFFFGAVLLTVSVINRANVGFLRLFFFFNTRMLLQNT